MLLKVVERIAILVVALLLLTVAARSQRYQQRKNRAPEAVAQLTANSRQAVKAVSRVRVAPSTEGGASIELLPAR
jgi:hypothetical protein